MRQFKVPIEHKGLRVQDAFRIDALVADLVVVEYKSVEKLAPIHDAQMLTCLRLYNRWLGLLINFNVAVLKDGFQRRVGG